MPRSHSTTSWLPFAMMYSAAIKQFLDRRRQAALEQDRPPHASELGEQREVLHVARANLQHVGVLGDEVDLSRVHHLGHDRQSRLGAHLGEESSASAPSPWNAYGDVRGLNAPPRSIVAPASRTTAAVVDEHRRGSRPSTVRR